jgi:precorrin-6A/cobalt-precorrin-6A reductase
VSGPHVLVLAGTAEAAELVTRLHQQDVRVTASFAGRTGGMRELPCAVRVGGFGGVDGLVAALLDGGFDLLVDATHPFAAVMPWHASAAAERAGVARLRVLRPAWRAGVGDRWDGVDDLAGAARRLGEVEARRVLLTVGRYDLGAFAELGEGTKLVVRSIEAPDADLVRGATVVTARGPFTVEGEARLLAEHGIDTLVTKNSGAEATAAKLAAAREAGVRVVMVRRPDPPPGPLVETVDEALDWVARRGGPHQTVV